MPRKFKEITLQTGKGLELGKTGVMNSAFRELRNLRVIDGNWKKRPGHKQLITSIPGTAAVGKCKAITEFIHPEAIVLVNEEEVPAGVLATVALGFYAGNIYGGINAAERYNRTHRESFLGSTRGMIRQRRVEFGITPSSQGGVVSMYFDF